jgi:hypothetical protein
MRHSQRKRIWMLAALIWLGVVGGGYAWLLRYSFAAGQTATTPHRLPASLASLPSSTRAQFFLALHPRCPCSRATVRELAKILSRAPGTMDVTVLAYKPADKPDSWLEGELLNDCRRMNCRICPDPDGKLAASLGNLTSGGVALYDANKRLRYQGGITASRGHEGDNIGESAVIEILQGRRDSHKPLPVFGCPIQEEKRSQHST